MELRSNRRSIVLDGKVTSLMLEPSFWQYLDSLAEAKGTSWADFVRVTLEEIGNTNNRAAAIKEHLLDHARGCTGQQLNGSSGNLVSVWEIETEGSRRPISHFVSTLLVGRSSACTISLADDECSRFHAALLRVDGHWWVMDLKSKNGTWLNDKRVERARLTSGQWLALGNSRLRLSGHDQSGALKP